MSDLDDTLDLWRKQSTVNREVLDEIKHLHAELAEIRDGLVALANRIEGVASLRAYPPPVIVPRPS